MKKVAVEEHLGTDRLMALRREMIEKAGVTMTLDPEELKRTAYLCCDIEKERIPGMEKNGIAMQVLESGANGVQFMTDADEAIAIEKEYNNYLSEVVKTYPDKFAAIGDLPLICPEAAAEELERCVKDLGLKGATIAGRLLSNGKFIDEPEFDCIWATAEKLNVPLYIHPTETFTDAMTLYQGCSTLLGPTLSWGIDTATYVSRIIFNGVFDKFPNVKLIMGHMGEMLPYSLWRMDNRWAITKQDSKNQKYPSEYFKNNIYISMSGLFSKESLHCALEAIGDDRILFAVDYPFEPNEEGCEFIDTVDIPESSREKICYKNADELFGLNV